MLEQIRRVRQEESGFTLIELLIVIVVLGVLSTIVVFAVSGINDRGQAAACQADVKTATVASEAYYAQNGSYAGSLDDLVKAGLLHSKPAHVTYSASGNTATVTGDGSSTCPSSITG